MRSLSLLLLLALGACQSEITDVLSRHQTAVTTLQAESDVQDLTQRYHEAALRYEQYEPLVLAEEARLEKLRAELRQAQASVASLTTERDAAKKAAADRTKERDEAAAATKAAEEAKAALDARKKAAEEALPALEKEVGELEARKIQVEAALADGRSEREVLTEEQTRLSGELEKLRTRARRLAGAHERLQKLLTEIDRDLAGG